MGLERYLEYMAVVNPMLEQIANDERLHFIPIADHLTGGIETFGDMCHMMDEGIALKAEIIFQYLIGGPALQ